jgi:hypothetical protein
MTVVEMQHLGTALGSLDEALWPFDAALHAKRMI